MLSAHNHAGYILAEAAERSDGPFYCPECRAEVLLKKGSVRTHHFAHIPPTNCIYGTGESEEHRLSKIEIYKALQNHPNVTKLQLERSLKEVRPDISFCLNGKYYIAIEVQLSSLSPDMVEKRTRAYAQKGIHVLWTPPLPDSMSHEERYSPKLWERYVHALYFGKVYYWVTGETLQPVRFDEHQLYVESREWFDGTDECSAGGYYKKSKRYKEAFFYEEIDIIDLQPVRRKAWQSDNMTIPNSLLWCEKRPYALYKAIRGIR